MAQQPSDGFLPYKAQAPTTQQKIGADINAYSYPQFNKVSLLLSFQRKKENPFPQLTTPPTANSDSGDGDIVLCALGFCVLNDKL